MTITANTALTKIGVGDAQKEQTINENMDAIDAMLGGRLSKSVAGNSNVLLTTADVRNRFLELTGALTGNIDVDVPNAATKGRPRLLWVYNNTSGSFTLTFGYEGGAGVVLPQGYIQALWHDGTDMKAAGPAFHPTTSQLSNSPPTYTPPTLLNSWVNFGGTHANAGYLIHNGVVHLRGLVKSGTVGAAVFQLPAGYRPAADLNFPTISNGAIGYVWVKSNGDVFAQSGSNVYFSLDSVRFVAGQ